MNAMRFAWIGVAWVAIVMGLIASDHTSDTLEAVKKGLADKKAVLIDVRELEEWNNGHLVDALLLPLSELKAGVPAEKLKKLLPTDKVIYLHCAAGGRCLKAADLLKAAGYETRPLRDGYKDLIKAGFLKGQPKEQ